MSQVTPAAKPLMRPITLCPYCDHLSPPGSKFCGECGAALHLMPCPQCGAVNDITSASTCYRCHVDLTKNASVALPPPAAAAADTATPMSASPEPTLDAPADAVETPSSRQRPHALVVSIVLVAFAAASYYAWRQRATLESRDPVHADEKAAAASGGTSDNTGVGNVTRLPAAGQPPASPSPDKLAQDRMESPQAAIANTTPASAPSATPAAPLRQNASAVPAAAGVGASPLETSRARNEAAKGLATPAPNLGPCTDAVAALGLCTPESTPRRQ